MGPMFPTTSGLEFCNVTLSMSHDNLDDNILMSFWLPATEGFNNRWLTLGGGGWSVSGSSSQPAGVAYGAAAGITDGGFGGFSSSLTANLLSPVNGTIAWSRLESFAYQAIHEMTVTGKELTAAFYNLTDDALKSYYMGCSEGGREGHMSTQRFPLDFDGVIGAAPAMYFPIMQLAQGWPNIAMAQQNHWPSPCALRAIQEDFISACDSLDGITDGVVSRTELCTYDASDSVGHTWSNCTSSGAPGAPASGSGAPTSGTISQADADVVKAIYKGAFDSNGNQIFWTYRPVTTLSVEAGVQWNNATQSYGPGDNNFFGTYYQNLVLKNTVAQTVPYGNITVDDVYQLMQDGLQDYGSWTETTWPDLTDFQARGGKLIHWHGEADTNLFPEASAHFHEKVRQHMFPNASGYDEIHDFYRFFLVPGAAHCSVNSYQPDGPFPQYALQQLISWVEDNIAPAYLNGSKEDGSSSQDKICLWPARPSWDENGAFSCVDDGNTAEEFIHPLNGWKV
ncbi:tannase and feruloyl esterase, partial [Athelia psychrophila]